MPETGPESVTPKLPGESEGPALTVSEPLTVNGAEMVCRPESIQMSALAAKASVPPPATGAMVYGLVLSNHSEPRVWLPDNQTVPAEDGLIKLAVSVASGTRWVAPPAGVQLAAVFHVPPEGPLQSFSDGTDRAMLTKAEVFPLVLLINTTAPNVSSAPIVLVLPGGGKLLWYEYPNDSAESPAGS